MKRTLLSVLLIFAFISCASATINVSSNDMLVSTTVNNDISVFGGG